MEQIAFFSSESDRKEQRTYNQPYLEGKPSDGENHRKMAHCVETDMLFVTA
jgi:hypothetical protein